MSSLQQGSEIPGVSRWIAPDVGATSAFHEMVSEASLAKVREEARQTGHAEGLQAGMAQGKAQTQSRLALLENLIQHVSAPLAQLEPEALAAMLELSLKVARVLINREISVDSSLVLAAISQALEAAAPTASGFKIAVNPADLVVVQEIYSEFATQNDSHIVGDGAIERGGAIVESGTSLIDAQLDARLETTLAALLDPVETR